MKTVVFTTFDKNYFFYSAVMMRSLSDNYSGTDPLEVRCLVTPDVLEKEDIYKQFVGATPNLNIKFMVSDKFLKFTSVKSRAKDLEFDYLTKNVWHRIFIGSLFSEFDKAIHIDPDTLILRDIQPMLDYPMYGKFMARVENEISIHGLEDFLDTAYFNAGVFITDLNYWREADVESQVVNYVKTYGTTNLLEQDILNRLMAPVFYPLPGSFNLPDGKTSFPHTIEVALILHFVGPVKPWLSKGQVDRWTLLWRAKYNRLLRRYKNLS